MENEIIDALIFSLGAKQLNRDFDKIHKPSRETILNYENIFNSTEMGKIKDVPQSQKINSTLNLYFSEIMDANAGIADYRDKIILIPIDSENSNTTAFNLGSNTLIVYDSFSMLFLWMMNKAHYYNMLNEDIESSAILFFELLLHLGTTLNEKHSNGIVFPKPKTPQHEDLSNLILLTIATETQEKFLLAHEIAHIIISDKLGILEKENCLESPYLQFFNQEYPNKRNLEIELAADKLAFTLVANTMTFSDKTSIEFFCNNIFLLMRYFLWSNLCFSVLNKDLKAANKEWNARSSNIRGCITDFCSDKGGAGFIIDLLDVLEQTLEPASLQASKIFEKVIKHTE